jgi:predicted metalloprotease with PDZ domain
VCLVFTPQRSTPTVRLPGWTPGSYLIRDYVRTLEGLRASQGEVSRPCLRTGPASWRLELDGAAPVVIRYSILATDLSVRTCHLNGDHAFLALAGVVLEVEGERWSPHRLELRLPETWQPFLPLPPDGAGGWCARDYDELIDSPLEAGPHPSHDFQVSGVPHRWVTWGGDLPATDAGWLADVQLVCLACCRLMGVEAPPSREPYLFVLHLLEEGYGGLEHDQAAVLQFGRRGLARAEGRRKLLQLVAHEYLHQWNVRRLRPAELTPIDYDRPVVVPSLWFAEGVTSYVDQILPLAAGIGTEAELLDDLGADLSRYLLTPGRRVQSLRQSSQEAWVKLYRQDAYSADSQISYYLKGAVLALVLDLHLRRHGSALSQVLRSLWRSHGRWRRGYREEDLIGAFAAHAADLSTLLPKWLTSTEDPAVEHYLADVGLRLVPESSSHRFMGWQLESIPQAGLQLKRVERDGPAEQAGLQVGDELVALDLQRIRRVEDLGLVVGSDATASPLPVLFCRDGRVRSTEVCPRAPGIERWRLQLDPTADPGTAQRRASWLSLEP